MNIYTVKRRSSAVSHSDTVQHLIQENIVQQNNVPLRKAKTCNRECKTSNASVEKDRTCTKYPQKNIHFDDDIHDDDDNDDCFIDLYCLNYITFLESCKHSFCLKSNRRPL